MGLLKESDILSWTDLVKNKQIIKRRGLDQFIQVYKANKDIKIENGFVFGEELELTLVIKDQDQYKLYCGNENIIGKVKDTFVEYGRYMVEISSVVPYNLKNIMEIEKNIKKRIEEIDKLSDKNVSVVMLPCFPNMTYSKFYDTKPLVDDSTLSLNFPDNGITEHKRFHSFTKNIRNRRGKKIEGYVEVMKDINTLSDEISKYILIDSMGQGMGCCGLQITVQGSDVEEARYLYDMMGILGPLFLRLTKGTPCASARLLNTETRWKMLEISVDCRTSSERGFECEIGQQEYNYNTEIPKSRFSPFDLYISNSTNYRESYNDIKVPTYESFENRLKNRNIDDKLSRHIASLFVRDPIISYLDTSAEKFEDFENIQSSNWRSVRFKIPSTTATEDLRGWKVEVRTMEMQATYFENSAYIYLVFLLARAITKYNLNFYIPISKVDSNYIRANQFILSPEQFKSQLPPDNQLFYYRTNIEDNKEGQIKEGTLRDIFLGKDKNKGIMFYIRKLISEELAENQEFLLKYIEFIERKISGEYMSLSDWIRKFVINHKSYKQDSVINDEILNDLIERLISIKKENTVEYLKND